MAVSTCPSPPGRGVGVRALVPSDTPASLKVTMPVGLPAPSPFTLTVAVNVTLWPKTDGSALTVRVVLVAA